MYITGTNLHIENGTVSIRRRGEGDLGAKSLDEAIAYFREEAAK